MVMRYVADSNCDIRRRPGRRSSSRPSFFAREACFVCPVSLFCRWSNSAGLSNWILRAARVVFLKVGFRVGCGAAEWVLRIVSCQDWRHAGALSVFALQMQALSTLPVKKRRQLRYLFLSRMEGWANREAHHAGGEKGGLLFRIESHMLGLALRARAFKRKDSL